jgi:hypothetical protein
MNEKRCPDCGHLYRTAGEILEAGGSTKQIGLALFGICFCGGDLGGVGSIWKPKREHTAQPDNQDKSKPAAQAVTLTGD